MRPCANVSRRGGTKCAPRERRNHPSIAGIAQGRATRADTGSHQHGELGLGEPGMIEIRRAAQCLDGEVRGRNQVACPGPGHSRNDRSLSVRFDPSAAGGFVVHSFANDDPILCRDYVRQRLNLPEWKPGDERDRRVPSSHKEFDRMAMDREAERRPRSEDDLFRIKDAAELWHSAKDPRGTVAEDYLRSRSLELPDDLAYSALRYHPCCPWRDENTGFTKIPALIAAFRSIDDDVITGVH